jgi:hypothetical protein
LPADIHKQVTKTTDPFPERPKAKMVTALVPDLPALAPAAALKKQGERVVVQFKALGGDIHSTEGHVELFTETTRMNEQCLIVRILKSEPAPAERRALLAAIGENPPVRLCR